MLEPDYGKQAAATCDAIEGDPRRAKLWDSICDTIELVCDHPGSAPARQGRIDDSEGVTWWIANIPAPGEPGPWRLIWRQDGNDAVIGYIGT